MTEASNLAGKTALITGASRNLGATIAQTFAMQGVSVAVNYATTDPETTGLMTEIREHGVKAIAVQGDMANGGDVKRVVETTFEAFDGQLDIVVNNAGPFNGDPYAELAESEWDRIMNSNLKAAYQTSQLAVPAMKQAGWGRIINLSAASVYLVNHGVYALAKVWLNYLTEQMAAELGPEITVNAIAPGQIIESAPDIGEIDPTFVERAIAITPTGRLVHRAEVANVVLWLCTPAADSLTGHVIPLDGGWRFNRF
jgi:3-oxoacyl-[acyl-carrier protein] reductase